MRKAITLIRTGAFHWGVHWLNDDRMVSNFLFTGTKQEVLEWLESQDGQQQVVDAYIRLQEKLIHLF